METSIPGTTSFFISDDTIRQKLSSIFVDSIVLDNWFNIAVVSQNVLELLEFTNMELSGKSLNYLAGNSDVVSELRADLSDGLLKEKSFTLYTKSNAALQVALSGFYLGLVSDINGKIILLVRCKTTNAVPAPSEEVRNEVDSFIYRAAHDLRGPLATIKGLINLIKIRENDNELDRLVQLVDSHANKLDERLFQLVYLSQYQHEAENTLAEMSFSVIETRLRRIIEKNAFIDFLDFDFEGPSQRIWGISHVQLATLCENLLHHVLGLSLKNMHSSIFFRVERLAKYLLVSIRVTGFESETDITGTFADHSFQYTDLVKHPKLIHFYAAHKLASQLQSTIDVRVQAPDRQRIEVRIPLS